MLAHGLTTEQLGALIYARLVTVTTEPVIWARAALNWLRLGGEPADGRSAVGEASPPATVDWMARIQRHAIKANIGAKPARLDKPLRGIVATLAQALERTEPEFVHVAMMWPDVIADFCRRDDAALKAITAERMLEQLVPADPAQRAVEYHLSHFVSPRTP